MVKIKLKTERKKTKRVKAFKKNKKNKTRKNKTRKNKKMTGGEKRDSCDDEAENEDEAKACTKNDITEINTNDKETEFSQRNAIINYGVGPISTYNLASCLSIGGNFEINENFGTFLTHESSTDFLEQKKKLLKIKEILDKKKANITNIILFRIDEKSLSDCKGRSITEPVEFTIKLMIAFLNKTFELEPIVKYYSCNSSLCGKAIISPTESKTTLEPFRPEEKNVSHETETFKANVLYNKDGKKIYECPICKLISGTDFTSFIHAHDCPNKNKIPIE